MAETVTELSYEANITDNDDDDKFHTAIVNVCMNMCLCVYYERIGFEA